MVGICLNWGFMGVTAVQLYIYHISYPDDTRNIKALVYSLFVLDCLQTGLVTADAFHWFVFGFGNMNTLDDTFLNSWDVPMLDAIISLIVQSFYSWRVYVLRKSFIFPVIITLISLMQCAAGIAVAVQAHKLGHLSKISTEVGSQTTWLVGATATDLLITAVLTWTLLSSKSRVHQKSHGMINRIVTLTVETNAATTFITVLSLILFLGVPSHSTLVVPPTAIMGKVYTNCLIAVLNNRQLTSRNNTAYGSHGTVSTSHSRGGIYTSKTASRAPDNSEPQNGQLHVRVVKDYDMRHDDFELNSMNKKITNDIVDSPSVRNV
jgi:hypothetical protein